MVTNPEEAFVQSAVAMTQSFDRHATLKEFRLQWRLMNAYERFEQLVVLALGLIIAGIILMALFQLYLKVARF